MSYYKYAKRGADTRVDWGAISTNLVKTLKDQEADRETQRQEIDKESVAVGKRLADAPQGANKAASTWILNASADAAQLMMTQNRLLKSGIVDPRDFTINRQNVDNSFAALKTIADTANKESELTMKRINAGEGQPKSMQFEGVAAQRVNEFQDFSKTRVFWNPDDGVASIGILNDLGTLSDNPAKFSTIEGAVNQMQARYDKIEYTPSLQKWADSLGDNIQVVNKNGVLTVSDPSGRELDEKTRKEVMASLDDTLSALMVNDIHTLSMAEDLGLVTADDYDLGSKDTSWGADESRKVGVTTQNDGILFPKSNDALNEAVREKLRTDALAMVGYKETAMPKDYSRDAYYRKLNSDDKEIVSTLDNVAGLYSGDVEELQSTIQDIMGGNTLVTYAKRNDRGIEIKTADGSGDALLSFYTKDKLGNDILMSAADFTKSAVKILTGDTQGSYDRILEAGNWSPQRTNFNAIDEVEFRRGAEAVDYMVPYRELQNKITAEPFKAYDNSAAATLSTILSPLGFTVEPDGSPYNKIIVKDLRGDKESIIIPTRESSDDAKSQMAKLKAWINEHRTDIEKGQFGYEQGKAGSNSGLNASEVMKEKAKTEQE
tara:strand:+ start:3538 stop:5349 length:1812 start_codon:yes stop_codon:yes gene_type:complete